MRKRITILLVIVVVGLSLVLVWRPRQQPEVFGTLPREDVSEIVRIVRSEMRHDLLPDFSFARIRELPSSIRRHWSDRVLSIHAETNGTVKVMTGVVRGPLDGSGNTYKLKRGSKGWEITSRGFWISGLERSPNKITAPNAGGPRQFAVRTPLAARVGEFWRTEAPRTKTKVSMHNHSPPSAICSHPPLPHPARQVWPVVVAWCPEAWALLGTFNHNQTQTMEE